MNIGGGAIDAMKKSYNQNRNLLKKRKSLKELYNENLLHKKSSLHFNFKEITPEQLEAFKLKVREENRRTLIKTAIVFTITAFLVGLTLYYILTNPI